MFRRITRILNVTVTQERVKFPEKLKGTIFEKWADYWKNLFFDYRQMLHDLRTDIQDEPKKALSWCTGIFSAYVLASKNPSEIDFKDYLKRISNEMALVGEECRNPIAVDYLSFIETSYSYGVLHYRNLGLLSVMYVSELNEECDLYKTHCKYLQPSYLDSFSRIVDVGFMGQWWNIYKKTANYDINY